MAHLFDPGYGLEPFRTLCAEYPEAPIYPAADFRTEWGPVFHRGRLNGGARILVIGQDPAQHETIARRILVGEAGHRIQGFLTKLGIDQSYVMINSFLYSVYGQRGGTRHQRDPGIVQYRNRWLDALLVGQQIEAVVALGTIADLAWKQWKATPRGSLVNPQYARITHPTQPESSSKGDGQKRSRAMAKMLQNWNRALLALKPALPHPDRPRSLILYGADFQAGELVAIPEGDLPAGTPRWMRSPINWAARSGPTPALKRATITVTVPKPFRP